MSILFYLFYNLCLLIALPFIWVIAFFNAKLGDSLSGQKELFTRLDNFNLDYANDQRPRVWLHAASAGEFEQLKPLLDRLIKQDVLIFQTFTSTTIYYKAAHDKRFNGVCFLPWDLYHRVSRFIKLLQPDIMINTRHDIWPNLLLALHRHHVRNVLINANLYANSKRLLPVSRQINQRIFKYIDGLYTGSSDLKTLLERLYQGPISVVGDSRFDQVMERSKTVDSGLIPANIIADRKVIVYGSVGTDDIAVVCSAIAKSLKTTNLLHIIVPHEVKERDLTPWEIALFRVSIASARFTEQAEYTQQPVLIWNRVGELADLYQYATLAYIGAGFSTGVHSVTEPAIYQVPCAHGPKYDILAEAIELVEMGLSTVVNSAEELVRFLVQSPAAIKNCSRQIETFVGQRLGATDKIIKAEFPLVKS